MHKAEYDQCKKSPSLYKGEACIKGQRQYWSEMPKYWHCKLGIYNVLHEWQNISGSPFPMHRYLILRKQMGKKDTVFPRIRKHSGTMLDQEENYTAFG